MSKKVAITNPLIANVDVRITIFEGKVRERIIETLEFMERKLQKKRQMSERDLVRLRTKLLGIAFYLPPEFMPKAQFFDKVLTNLKNDYGWLKNPDHAMLNDLLEQIGEIKKKHRTALEELAECRRKLKECGCAS